ncbi:MAG TPA: enoyl-CoA hydratase-related protein [Alphaproteobacteria bacterium]|jgi:enoyl-CoA hydratase|nr:enoyl-CoA hydratase-related protein [Alphaproteobacteria bacterium]
MSFSGYKTLKFARDGRVLRVTIDGNGPRNPVDDALHSELARVFAEIQGDAESDVVMLTGAGRAFCAGGDMDWFQTMIDEPAKFRGIVPDAKHIIFGLLELEKPIVCRLNGAAAGLGASVALLCDIIVADETAKIGDPHVAMGLVAGDGGAIIWSQLVGYARAKEMLLTGEMMSARDAAAWGLINHAVPAAELDAKTDEIIAKLVNGATWAVRWTKTAINIPLRALAANITDAAVAYEILSQVHPDHQEAVAAFRDKRRPYFSVG